VNRTIRTLRRHPGAAALILVGVLLTLAFGFRAFRSFMRVRHGGLRPEMTDVAAIRDWMTVPYVARVFRVPEGELFRAIGAPPDSSRRKDLRQLDHDLGVDPGGTRAAIQEAVLRLRRERPPPSGPGDERERNGPSPPAGTVTPATPSRAAPSPSDSPIPPTAPGAAP